MQRALLLSAFFSLLNFISFSQESSDQLIGVWQQSPSLGSGWSTNYQFMKGGRFRYNHNQMNCSDSVLWEGGSYVIIADSILLHFDSLEYIAGGELVQSSGSCASEHELVGGELSKVAHYRKLSLALEFTAPKEGYEYLDRVLIEDKEWFRLLHNPADY